MLLPLSEYSFRFACAKHSSSFSSYRQVMMKDLMSGTDERVVERTTKSYLKYYITIHISKFYGNCLEITKRKDSMHTHTHKRSIVVVFTWRGRYEKTI